MPAPGEIQLLVGFSEGSASNIVAQVICTTLGEHLGQAVRIVRLPGANGALAAERLARAAPDGCTLGIAVPTHIVGSLLDGAQRYNPLADFAPVALFARNPLVLAISNTLEVNTLPGFIAMAKSRPGELVYGTSAIGGGPHLAALLFAGQTGIDMQMRVYAETNALYADLISGRIALTFNNPMSALPLARAGQLTILGVTSLARNPPNPELPSLAETALPGFDIASWVGMLAPAATPPHVVNRINAAVTQTIETPAVRRQLRALGIEPVSAPPDYFAAHLRAEMARWLPFVREHVEAFPGAQMRRPGV